MTRFRESVRSLLRQQVLDAAYGLVAADGWGVLRMTAIARAAGISRQTLYNEFGSKEAIGNALVQRELEGFLLGIQRELDAHRGELEKAAAAGSATRSARRWRIRSSRACSSPRGAARTTSSPT